MAAYSLHPLDNLWALQVSYRVPYSDLNHGDINSRDMQKQTRVSHRCFTWRLSLKKKKK